MPSGRVFTRIALDPLFPPPPDFTNSKKTNYDVFPENKYELIFDEALHFNEIESNEQVHIEIEEKESEGEDDN
jgi:hypothetical protein